MAQQIVNYRKEHGAFTNREQLKDVPRLGVKTFEQAAGFLRIRDGEEPLDATGVHPESYDLVKQILEKSGKDIAEVLGNDSVINTLATDGIEAANDENISIAAIKQELAKPAHDPRPEFKTAQFRDDVNSVNDLEEGMQLEGVVTNVTGFGCFVDVGVHQDGLVHISEMANDFVEDPMNLVKPGDIVTVRVISVDAKRNRIGFSMKSEQAASAKPAANKPAADKAETKAARPPRRSNKAKPANKGGRTNPRNAKAKPAAKQKPEENKIGSLGALLKQAGLK